jgi:hypothetical protein
VGSFSSSSKGTISSHHQPNELAIERAWSYLQNCWIPSRLCHRSVPATRRRRAFGFLWQFDRSDLLQREGRGVPLRLCESRGTESLPWWPAWCDRCIGRCWINQGDAAVQGLEAMLEKCRWSCRRGVWR